MSLRLQLTTVDGVVLVGRHWQASDPAAAVVLVHGFAASSSDPLVEATALALSGTGLEVISYDARGHGGSGGVSTLGDLERHDVAAAVAFAREHSDAVIVVGASMGAIAALRHASEDPALAGVVAVSCPARWRLPLNPRGLLAAALTRTAPGRHLLSRRIGVRVQRSWDDPLPPVELVRRLHPPLALVHGDRDRFIPAGAAAELQVAACGPSHLSIVPGMGHAFSAAATPAVLAGVEWVLGAVPARA